MGPVITRQHRERVEQLIEPGAKEGAKVAVDGRSARVPGEPNGFFVGATVLDGVQSGMSVAREEIFGPVLNVMRFEELEEAIELANRSPYGNGASIFTRSGKAAREFKHRIKAGMVGVNIGVPASMAWFPFNGWDESFFGDLHMQGKEGVQFLHATKSHHDPLVQLRRRRHLAKVTMTVRDPDSPVRRMTIAVAAVVAIMVAAALVYIFLMSKEPSARFNGATIVAAARSYTRDLRARNQPVPKSVTLEELADHHFLKPEEVAAFRGMSATITLSSTESGPKTVLMRVHFPDGGEVLLLADGTVQQAGR